MIQRRSRARLALVMLLAVIPPLVSGACGLDLDHDDARLTGEWHQGWKNPHCGECHRLPVEDHQVTAVSACAECHGANGACDPSVADTPAFTHAADADCRSCHGAAHQLPVAESCAACHFASRAVVSCLAPPRPDAGVPQPDAEQPLPDPGGPTPSDVANDPGPAPDLPAADPGPPAGPKLSTALTSHCFDWPGSQWSSSSQAQVAPSLAKGELAVELALADPAGTPYTLSGLLATRPVLLFFGSFT